MRIWSLEVALGDITLRRVHRQILAARLKVDRVA